MSTAYLRHCPKHSRPGRPMPNPCAHCALAAKPAQVPEPAPAGTIPAPSAAALRANKYRERQKQDHPNFKEKEAARKQQERREKKNQNAEKWSKQHPGFPLNLKALRRIDGPSNDEHCPLFMKEAPRGKARLIRYGGGTELERASGERTANAAMCELPLRAQLSDEEFKTRLKAIGDLQTKITLILEHWKQDKEFCAWLNDLSLDEISQFVQYCADNPEATRQLLYERTEHQAGAQTSTYGPSMPQAQSQLTHAVPHGRRVEPSGISDNHEGDLGRETDRTFAKRISFKKRDVQVIRIGKRNARFYNLQNGEVEEHFTITFKTVKWKNTSQSLFRITAEVIKVGCASCADKDLKMGLTISERSIAKMWSSTFGGTRLRRGVQSQDEGATRTMMHSRRSALAL